MRGFCVRGMDGGVGVLGGGWPGLGRGWIMVWNDDEWVVYVGYIGSGS